MNKYRFIRIIPLILLLVLLIYKPLLVANIIKLIIIKLVYFYFYSNTNVNIIILKLVTTFILILIFKIVVYPYYKKLVIKSSNLNKNKFSKGNAKWGNEKSKKKSLMKIVNDNAYVDGYLVEHIAEFSIKLPFLSKFKITTPYFEPNLDATFADTLKNDAIAENMTLSAQKEALQKIEFKKSKYKKLQKFKFFLKEDNVKWIDTNPIDQFIIGTSRSGKSQTIVIPTILFLGRIKDYDKKPNLVISDPKEELTRQTSQALIDEGYQVFYLNTSDLKNSHSFNPLTLSMLKYIEVLIENDIVKSHNTETNILEFKVDMPNSLGGYCKMVDELAFIDCEDQISNFATSLIPSNSRSKDPYWDDNSRTVLESFIFNTIEMAVWKNQLDAVNMYNIYNRVTNELRTDDEDNILYITNTLNHLPDSNFARTSMSAATKSTLDSIISSLKAKISIFKNLSLGKMTAKNQINLEDICKGERPIAVFIITPDYDKKFNAFITIFVNQLYTFSAKYAGTQKNERLKRKLHFILDEFGNIPELTDLNTKLTVGLSRGIHFSMFVQTTEQLKSIYGEDISNTVLDSTHQKIYLLAGDSKTRQWFSEQVGTTTILTENHSGHDLDSASISTSEDGEPLVNEFTLSQNPFGTAYVVSLKNPPLKTYLRPAFTFHNPVFYSSKDYFDEQRKNNIINKLPMHEYLTKKDMLFEKEDTPNSFYEEY